jgi:hypothetical protein
MAHGSRQLKLRVLWRENFLGLGVDQIIAKKTSSPVGIPLTYYYLWPKTAAWEQLKGELDTMVGLTDKEKVKTLNTASDLINHWQKNRSNEDFLDTKTNFPEVYFMDF